MVLTDLNMPHLDGLQLCQAIRQNPTVADTPVAILSGGLQPGDPRTDETQRLRGAAQALRQRRARYRRPPPR